jgi:imidazoleglycerol-phosphate dehydratase
VVDDSAAGGDGGVGSGSAIFCCPLDEAFAEARVNLRPAAEMRGKCTIGLEPYGKFSSSPSGRRWIGRYQTALTPVFWKALASSLGAEVTLRRVRGDNAHHVLESAFKAFARAFRAALDNLADGQPHGCAAPSAGPLPPAAAPSVPRRADRRRATKETSIEVRIDLDAPWLHMDAPPTVRASAEPTSRVSTGITTLDKVLLAFSKAAGIEMVVHCEGDRHIDDHHSAEDVAITLGQCVHEALGDKAGLTRMACAEGAEGGARVRAVLDLSNRPHFESDLPLDEEFVGGADVGSKGAGATHDASQDDDASPCGGVLSSEMLFHVFDSLTLEMRSTCHLELLEDSGGTGHTLDLALAAARAFGLALSRAIRVDPRRGGAVASSKGTLSK